MKEIPEIILAGDNEGLSSIYAGMQSYAKKIYIFTNTPGTIEKRSNDVFIQDFFEVGTQLILCSAYAPLIEESSLDKKDFLNIHYAPLPRYRGMHPVVWGILNDEEFLGWTLHKMDAGMDSGHIIFQELVKNEEEKTSIEYMNLFHNRVKENIGEVVQKYYNNKIKPEPQDVSRATWGCRRNLKDCQIDFSFSHRQLGNFFRALVPPYPRPFIEFKGKRYFISKYFLHSANIKVLTRGRVCNIDSKGIYIKTKEGYLVAEEILDEEGELVDYRQVFRIGSRLNV